MSARSLNKVTIIGNLTRDPELRYTPQGTAVCTFGVATNRSWVMESGEKREETEFHRIVSWNKLAELCSQLLAKGRKVYVEGRLQTRNWTAQDGRERTTTEIVIDDMIILDSRRPLEEARTEGDMPAAQPVSPAQPVANVTPGSTDDQQKKTKKVPVEKDAKESPSESSEVSPDTPAEVMGPETTKEVVNPDDIPF